MPLLSSFVEIIRELEDEKRREEVALQAAWDALFLRRVCATAGEEGKGPQAWEKPVRRLLELVSSVLVFRSSLAHLFYPTGPLVVSIAQNPRRQRAPLPPAHSNPLLRPPPRAYTFEYKLATPRRTTNGHIGLRVQEFAGVGQAGSSSWVAADSRLDVVETLEQSYVGRLLLSLIGREVFAEESPREIALPIGSSASTWLLTCVSRPCCSS